tara:strand:+ start:26 stop:445 length:420 start_codon:yes stop_codon:yes gene_type:complete
MPSKKKAMKITEAPCRGISDATRDVLLDCGMPPDVIDLIEIYFIALKKKSGCGLCGLVGHKSTSCPHVREFRYHNPVVVKFSFGDIDEVCDNKNCTTVTDYNKTWTKDHKFFFCVCCFKKAYPMDRTYYNRNLFYNSLY